jgi:putative membrane protein
MTDRDAKKPPGELDPGTYLAAERTLLAWIRTGLAMMGFGFVVARFGLFLRELAVATDAPPERRLAASLWFGTTLVVLGVIVNVCAALQHWSTLSRLAAGQPIGGRRFSLSTITALALAALGLLMAIFLGMQTG